MSRQQTVAVLGAGGTMGAPMASNLARAGIAVRAWNRSREKAEPLAKDPVTSPLRAPFTTFEGTSGPAELAEEVRANGNKKTIGELVSCPFCIGMWVSTGFTAGYVFAPRATRLAASTLAVLAGSDFLQFAYAYAEQKAS